MYLVGTPLKILEDYIGYPTNPVQCKNSVDHSNFSTMLRGFSVCSLKCNFIILLGMVFGPKRTTFRLF